MRNRWGVEIKKGYFVQGKGPRGGAFSGVVVAVDSASAFARAYGTQLQLDSGKTVGADDVSQTLGNVKQNPLTRIKRSQIKSKPSQATGLPPDERLVKRRKKTANMVVPGIYANPLVRVTSRTSESQRSHTGPNGERTKHATRRLMKRRDYTDAAPSGFYANPRPLSGAVNHYGDSDARNWFLVSAKAPGEKTFFRQATFTVKSEAIDYAKTLHKREPKWSIKVEDER